MAHSAARGLLARLARVRAAALCLCALCAPGAEPAAAQEPVQRVEVVGARRTRHVTLLELLPRPPPAHYSDAELDELKRRIGNLEIFDAVAVERRGAIVRITVREKWTLIPEFDLATGTTPADLYVLLGATEYNVFGTASFLGLSVYRERRGFGAFLVFEEHVYRRRRWARAAELDYGSFLMRFPGGDDWLVTQAIGHVRAMSPPLGSDHLRYEVGANFARESVSEVHGEVRPPNGYAAGLLMRFAWDAYQWADLTPRGWFANLTFLPKVFFAPGRLQNRDRIELWLQTAVRLARYTALMARARAGVGVRGNPNHSFVIGSVEGVRGLEDALYFTWAQAFLNVELRQAVRLASRWALQGVLFSDVGVFERIDARGGRGGAGSAWSGGVGVRLVPTWLSGLVLRFDVARLVVPERAFFQQFGVRQYF